MLPKYVQYAPLSQYDIDDRKSVYSNPPTYTNESASPAIIQLQGQPKAETKPLHHWEWVTRGVLVLLSFTFFTLWVTSTGVPKCTYVIRYSPANEANKYIEHFKYKGSLHFMTPWRGDEVGYPGPDIDSAWRRITTDVKPIRITEEQLEKMGMEVTPTTVKFPEVDGGGYLASLEVTHHLQCLVGLQVFRLAFDQDKTTILNYPQNMLRKATYRNHYKSIDPAFQIEDETLMDQLDTCVEILRQALMCYPDTSLVAYYWVHGYKFPFPNNNVIHRCKDFDSIVDWAVERAVLIPSKTEFGLAVGA